METKTMSGKSKIHKATLKKVVKKVSGDRREQEFWEWMEKKGYVYIDAYNGHYIPTCKSSCSSQFTEQMLVGYFMEYLRKKKGKLVMNIEERDSIKKIYKELLKEVRSK